MNEMYVKDLLLANSRYWVLSKQLVKEVGIESAFFLTNLAEAEKMMCDDDGWFYQTIGTVEEMTTLSRYKQDICIKQLVDLGWLETDTRGIPPKRYFRLKYNKIAESLLNTTSNQIVNNSQNDMQRTDKSNCKKLATNKEHIYKEHNNKESNKGGGGTIPKEQLENIISKWNDLELAKIIKLNPTTERYKMLKQRIEEYDYTSVLVAIENIKYSSFLQGKNSRGWEITFDWLVRPNNFIKVLEEQYTDLDKPTILNKKEEQGKDNPSLDIATDEDGNPLVF